MNKPINYYLTLLLVSLVHVLYAQEHEQADSIQYHHCLFPKNSVMLGLALPYAGQFQTLGVNSRVYYNVNSRICFGPEFSYFKNKDQVLWDVNLVMHYIFETRLVGIYPLGGINYSREDEENEIHSEFGAVWGVGIHRNVKRLTLFVEYASVVGKLDDQFLTSGVLLTIR